MLSTSKCLDLRSRLHGLPQPQGSEVGGLTHQEDSRKNTDLFYCSKKTELRLLAWQQTCVRAIPWAKKIEIFFAALCRFHLHLNLNLQRP